MNDHTSRLLTIVTEAAIEHLIVQDIERLGAQGYTVSDVRGKGSRGVRDSAWDASSNVRIEIVCDSATAVSIADWLRAHYYDNYAMIMFFTDIQILRPEKF